MKVYPKIPRYDHPTVDKSVFDASDLTLIEKVDGSAFRFTLFEDRFRASYPEVVAEAAAGDGSLVFGTRKSIRGSHRDDLDEIDEVINERMGPPVVDVRYHHAGGISVLGNEFRFEPFVVG